MKMDEQKKKAEAPADEAEAPEAPKPGEPLSDAELDAVSGGDAYPGSFDECVSALSDPAELLREDQSLPPPRSGCAPATVKLPTPILKDLDRRYKA